jgi:O-antigen ligase
MLPSFVNIVLVLVAAYAIFRASRKNIMWALCVAIGLMVALPTDIRIDFGGGLPDITVQRAILITLFICWRKTPWPHMSGHGSLITKLLFLLLIARAFSLVFSITPLPSFKELLSFAIETVLFFKIASSLIASENAKFAASQALVYGLMVVALMAVIERYAGISVPGALLPRFRFLAEATQSTYPDQHLFGYAMAMGAPLVAAMLDLAVTKGRRRILWAALALMVAGCYFSNSRGPWLGMAIAFGVYFILGSPATRRRYIVVVLLALATLAIRPGVRDTIVNMVDSTFQQDDIKGLSYSYRWRLWPVAWSEISKSPIRVLFGYGGLSTESMDLSRYFEPRTGGSTYLLGYTSWDNQYAANLIEFGVVAFVLEALLCFAIVYRLLRSWNAAIAGTKVLSGALVAAAVVFLFAQSNLWIFSIQLKFLFWTVVAIGNTAIQRQSVAVSAHEAAVADYGAPRPCGT